MLEKLRVLPRLLQGLAGARQEVLAKCPAEAVKFESLGWSILITSGMGVVSMWFALATAMGVNGLIAMFPALAWGFVIMGIDRWLITSMPHDGKRKLLIAAPRLLMAFLLGTLISTPFVLRIFEAEINAQISVIKENNYNSFIAEQQTSTVGQQVTYWAGQVNSLQQEIDSGGAKTINPADDSEVKAWTSQRNTDQQVANQDFKTWQCQLYGVFDGIKCPKGNGPLAQASENAYNSEEATIKQLNTDIQSRESDLTQTNAAADKQRLEQAQQALPNAMGQLHTAQTREDNLRDAFNASNQALNGILVRLEALSQLSRGNFTVTLARFLVFLLFLVIEILPVTVKLMQRPGPYEELYDQMQRSYVRNAKRSGPRGWRAGAPDTDGAAYADGYPAGGTQVIQGRAELPEGSVRDLFVQTKVLPRGFGNSPDRQPTEVIRDDQFQQGGYRDSEFQQGDSHSARGFQRGTTSSYQDFHQTRDQPYHQDDYGAPPTRNEAQPAPTRQEAHPTRVEESLPADDTRREFARRAPVPPGAPAAPGQRHPGSVTDSGGLSLAHQSMLNMNDDRPSSAAGAPDSGELDWDEG
jgi:hypothetical protein